MCNCLICISLKTGSWKLGQVNRGSFLGKYPVKTFFFITDKPVCVEGQKTIYGVSEGETAHISCHVDSYPESDSFAWSFNTTSGGMDLSRETFTNQVRGRFQFRIADDFVYFLS